MEQNRNLSKETNKKILRRDTLRISVAAMPRFNVKKESLVFKILPPIYLHIIKIDIKQWTTTCVNLSKILISKQITLAVIFYRVGMVSSNNLQKIYSDDIHKPLQQKPFYAMFLTKKRWADAQYLITNFKYDQEEVQKQLFADVLQNRCS